jgi:hypothetical protein
VRIVFYLLALLLSFILLGVIIGFLLPKERIERRVTTYKASPKTVYEIVVNNNDFSYRSDLTNLQIIENDGELETWKEISKNGQEIIFKTVEKIPYSRYEFEIVEANGVKGNWIGEFNITESGGTEFISTEKICIENPVIRLLSNLFFDLEKFMETYQKDLAKKLKEGD